MTSWIQATGEYLLTLLRRERSVLYSRFYNANRDTAVTLVDGMWPFLEAQPEQDREPLDAHERECLLEEAHVHLEWAAYQLADLGVVRITTLEGTRLIDGEPDFRIDLTERGERFIAGNEKFAYRHLDSRFRVASASQWLISFVYHNSDVREAFVLRGIMEVGESDGGVAVTDESGNRYGLGTNTYAWAFEVCLWHHARQKHIEPVFEYDAQRQAWARMLARQYLPERPDLDNLDPVWDVPFRIAGGVDVEKVRHVGLIGGE